MIFVMAADSFSGTKWRFGVANLNSNLWANDERF